MKNLTSLKNEMITEILESKPTGYISSMNTMLEFVKETIDFEHDLNFTLEVEDWNGDRPVIVLRDADDEDAPAMEFEEMDVVEMDWNMITEIYKLI
jgi:hypothetical protein